MRFLRHPGTASKTTRAVVLAGRPRHPGGAVSAVAVAMAVPVRRRRRCRESRQPQRARRARPPRTRFAVGDVPVRARQRQLCDLRTGTSGWSRRRSSQGSHTFKVDQVGTQTSGDASYTSDVDTSAPSAPVLTLSKAAAPLVTGTTAYYNGASGSGSSITVAASTSDAQSGSRRSASPR